MLPVTCDVPHPGVALLLAFASVPEERSEPVTLRRSRLIRLDPTGPRRSLEPPIHRALRW